MDDTNRIIAYYLKSHGEHKEKTKETVEALHGFKWVTKPIRVISYAGGGDDFRARNEAGDILDIGQFISSDSVVISNDNSGQPTEVFKNTVNCFVKSDSIFGHIQIVKWDGHESTVVDLDGIASVNSWGGDINLEAFAFQVIIKN